MAISSSYYLNAPSLGSATAVFLDTGLLTCAPDGFYSNGVIVREQVGCVLLPQQDCGACPTPCGTTINASGGQGIYLLDLGTGDTSTDIGAVVVRFDPYGVPDGIKATLGSSVYNKLTSPVDGLHQSSNAASFTYVGQTSADCGISGTTYPSLLEYRYNGTTFVATGGLQSITVAPGDVSLGVSPPGNTMMVIPKLTPSPSIINFEVVGPCSGTAWTMSIDCPVLLTGFSSSIGAPTSIVVCGLSETTTYYNASLSGTSGTVGLYDFVFADAYGLTPLPAGFYKATGSITGGNDWFQVSSSGVVIALGICIPITYNCVSGTCIDPGDGTGTYSSLVACEAGCFPITYNCVSGNCIDPGDGTGTYSTLIDCQNNCSAPTIQLGSPICRENNCNDNAACSVRYGINTSNAPIGSYITVAIGFPSSTATVTVSDSTPPAGQLLYYEPSGSATPVYFDLQLRDSGGTIIATSSTSLTHSSFWPMLPLCTPILVSYNCVSGNCIDPGDGSGTYATLVDCQNNCGLGCLQYEVQNMTESAIGIDYYDCSGVYQNPSIPSGSYLVFCSDTSYGPINSGGQTLSTIGTCPTSSATLSWKYNEGIDTIGNMDLYVNGSIIESRSSTSGGTWTVYVGDTINVDVSCSGCVTPNGKANAYTYDIIADATCADGSTTLNTTTYTVTSGDLGNVLSLRIFSKCDGGCN